MASVNKAFIVGYLGRDPETRYSSSGEAITNINIATTDSYKDKSTGERKETTEWHRVVFFGRLAEVAKQYLEKGDQVYVDGRIRTRKWQDQNGQERYTTEIVAGSLQFLGGGKDGDAAKAEKSPGVAQKAAPKREGHPATPTENKFDDLDDDIPF